MAADSKGSSLGVCYLLMASLFAVSVQFNDPDWYCWIPLYTTASIANFVNWAEASSRIRKMARFAFCLGIFLFVKIAIGDYFRGAAGFWSLDMRERIVRERFGSGFVTCSMFLLLENSSGTEHHDPSPLTKHGLLILVGVAYGISFVFFAFQHDEMRY